MTHLLTSSCTYAIYLESVKLAIIVREILVEIAVLWSPEQKNVLIDKMYVCVYQCSTYNYDNLCVYDNLLIDFY